MSIHFTKEEFAERKLKVINKLKDEGLEALLMFKQESMYWLTGYDTFGFVFFQCLVLTAKGDLILLTRAPDLRQAQNTSVIQDIRIWVDKDGSSPSDELKNILVENHWTGFRPGTKENIPIIGKDGKYENVYINSGHFRYGLTMAPKSAEIINSLLIESKLCD